MTYAIGNGFYNTMRYSKARSLCRYSVGKSLRHTLSVIYALVALGNKHLVYFTCHRFFVC